MTVIRPNSISGVTSITALTQSIEFYKSDGSLSGANIDGISINTSGIITATTFVGNLTGTATQVSLAAQSSDTDCYPVFSLTATGNQALYTKSNRLSFNSVTGALSATSFVGDGSQLTGLNSDLVNDTSPQLGGDLDTNSHHILLDDSHSVKWGNATELEILHTGSSGYAAVHNSQGNLLIDTTGNFYVRNTNGSKQSIVANPAGATELYHDNSKRFETVTGGIKVTGAYALAASSGNNPTIDNADGGNGRSLYFKTGGSARLIIQEDGHTRPASNNTFDLGTTSDRWRNIYTNDLNLSNKGSTNCVDNTWGDYTIQEGESDLFLINNRSGKKYKFNLTEVN